MIYKYWSQDKHTFYLTPKSLVITTKLHWLEKEKKRSKKKEVNKKDLALEARSSVHGQAWKRRHGSFHSEALEEGKVVEEYSQSLENPTRSGCNGFKKTRACIGGWFHFGDCDAIRKMGI